MTGVVHVAGVYVQINGQLRQRCAWCGAVLVDYDLTTLAVPVGQGGSPATWPVGEMVMVDGPMSYVVEHDHDQPLPDGACGRLDPAVTA